jgi:glycosyltransferase involved in cell wall biosynthesis
LKAADIGEQHGLEPAVNSAVTKPVIHMELRSRELPEAPAEKSGWPWDRPVRRLPARMPNGQPWPRITVVTPSNNQGQFLEETIRSVVSQEYPDLEYIVIDGKSSDNSVQIIRKYETFISYWISEQDSGQPAAVNKGMARSTGDILGWVNSDDLLLPRALERTALARMNPEVKITCGFREVIDSASRIIRHCVHPRPNNEDLKRICYLAQETVFWNREVWEKAGPLGVKWRYALDFDLWQKFMAAGYQFHLIPFFLGCFRVHPQHKGITMNDVRTQELEEIYKTYLGREVSERVLDREIQYSKRMRLIKRLARTRVFHQPWLADRLVDWAYLPANFP